MYIFDCLRMILARLLIRTWLISSTIKPHLSEDLRKDIVHSLAFFVQLMLYKTPHSVICHNLRDITK